MFFFSFPQDWQILQGIFDMELHPLAELSGIMMILPQSGQSEDTMKVTR